MTGGFVFFDLDNTILDFSMAERVALSRVLTEQGVEPTEARLKRYSAINLSFWERLENGELTRGEVLSGRFTAFFGELGLSISGAEASARYEELLHEGHWFMPGAQELLRSLQGIERLFLASNGIASVQRSRLRSAGITDCFEQLFISEELGADKPQRAFFDRAFAMIEGFDRSKAVMVGDSLTSDIRGGKNAGIATVWYNPDGRSGRPDIVPDWEIRELSELPGLLRGLPEMP